MLTTNTMRHTWQNLPESFLARLPSIVPSSSYDAVLEAFSSKRPTTFRVNTLNFSIAECESSLSRQGVTLSSVNFIQGAFIVETPTLRELTDLDLYKNGCFYVQSLSSMVPALVLHPQKDERVLDICAAPGSKTTQIAAMMENTGEIVANDSSHIRIYKLEANLKVQGVTNTKVRKGVAQTLWQEYPEYFDKTLVDVPCSMEGRFNASDPKTYSHWTPKKIKELVEHQRWILRSAISATKPGGTIVYSTCTLSPEENEGVIEWILKKEKGAVELVPLDMTGIPFSPALAQWNNKLFDSSMRHTARILPSATLEGFFVAKLRKKKSTVPSSSLPMV